jgi:hypothetical protein
MWIATPSSQWTSTTYSLPVSRRTHRHCGLSKISHASSTLSSPDHIAAGVQRAVKWI